MAVSNPRLGGYARDKVCDWLNANGINPAHTPEDPRASLSADGRELTLLQKVRHPDGGDVIDPDNPNQIMTRTVTVPVIVAPDGLVRYWLAPRCSECGR